MSKRLGKFYSKNEKAVMEKLGLIGTKASGAGWLEKEDGYNDYVIAQLKSTDANSYRISLDDIDKLEYHALVEHKVPLFIIEFLQRDELYFMFKPQDLVALYKYLTLDKNASEVKSEPLGIIPELILNEDEIPIKRKTIKSSKNGKNNLNKQIEKEREKRNEQFKKNQRRKRK